MAVRGLSLTGAIVAVSVGVLLPVVLSTSVGIIAIATEKSTKELVMGVLIVSFTCAAIGGAVVSVVLLGRKARLARLQSDLLANVSHELRTPLAAIRMYAQTLESGLLASDPEHTRQSLATIVRESERLEATIERVLNWRALARDRAVVELQPGSLRGAVTDAVERFGRMVAPGEVGLVVEIGTDAPVDHDREAIARVLLNLLVNAHKYTYEDKQVGVTVQDDGRSVAIAVRDNGIGIPRSELDRIFLPFHRVEADGASRAAGAGLGLAIVRHLVRAHGGEVEVESRPGEGSTFTVRLPLSEREPA
ncbi:MAG: HAMP domain-containing histidine kinase [Thermoanaerobaculaceae bacterium]|nr:HAMP domain-containing histidine kinase [Thermoanaerobaculaceae bacterium]MDI9621123.1 HAMP domain-containing sensor histidine kinase [Acidobacteriota bacterium]NLH12099.1 HAMP domain-containing histidine kinase [Holophagae bacterium]HPW55558.1 HAMP domain-containing sensor histidine kinase [Thermoanaerobaculaceae bacterium]